MIEKVKTKSVDSILIEQALQTKEVLTVSEAAIYMDISVSEIYKKTHNRSVPFYKPNNGKIYFKRIELEEYLLSNRIASLNEIGQKVKNFQLKSGRN